MVTAAVRTEVRANASGTVAARLSSSVVEGLPDARPRRVTSIVASMPQSAPAASGHPDAPVTRRYTTATRSTAALAWLTRTIVQPLAPAWHHPRSGPGRPWREGCAHRGPPQRGGPEDRSWP